MLRTTPGKPSYPNQLLKLPSPPKELFILSDNWENLQQKPMLAVVGSRKVSPYGHATTQQLASAAAARGIVIVSGLALGIDGLAHQAALDANGLTIAVLPCGLDYIYPKTHFGLAMQIIEKGGALISEYPPHSEISFKGNFIARNRIISGLSSAVLIPEAAEKSGSLHTANFALSQGRDVLAVPGPINSPLSAGCNKLIKAGATPVTCIDDILDVFHIQSSVRAENEVLANNEAEQSILNLLKLGTSDIDELQAKSGLSATDFQQSLSMLEITGRVKPLGGGRWSL